jgi:uncharacterized protein YacL (UPF0231 family)
MEHTHSLAISQKNQEIAKKDKDIAQIKRLLKKQAKQFDWIGSEYTKVYNQNQILNAEITKLQEFKKSFFGAGDDSCP